MKNIVVKMEYEIPYTDIVDFITCALEGGSNYWYYLPDLSMLSKHIESGDQPYLVDRIVKAVLVGGESVPVYDIEDPENKLGDISQESIQRGFQLYAEAGNPLDPGDADADNADILFQLIVMGEVTFG